MEKLYKGFRKTRKGSIELTLVDIKFRGEWVYGSLIDLNNRTKIYVKRKKVKVVPYTVREAVPEVKDDNGTQIFNSDILRSEFLEDRTNQTFVDYYVVEYCFDRSRWIAVDLETGEEVSLYLVLKDKTVVVGNTLENDYTQFKKEVIDNDDEYYDPDAHSCSANADDYGICQVCGAIVHGSQADHDLHGY